VLILRLGAMCSAEDRLQPLVRLPETEVAHLTEAVPHWKPNMTFADFAQRTMASYY
jgi:hypothetical protein